MGVLSHCTGYLLMLPFAQDMGIGKGKGYALNFPLRDGITDEAYKGIFEPVSVAFLRAPWPLLKCNPTLGHRGSDANIRSHSCGSSMRHRFAIW